MFEKLQLTGMAQAMAAHAGSRLSVISRNIANADTPGYRAQDLPDFARVYDSQNKMRATRPGHLDAAPRGTPPKAIIADGAESPNGNTVSLEQQMVKSIEARQQHEMALGIYRATSGVLRASLGKQG